MLEIAADANTLGEDIEGGLSGSCVLIVKDHMVVDPVADVLDAVPGRLDTSKQLKGDIVETINLAVSAVEQVAQDLMRQIAHGSLTGGEIECVWEAGVTDERAAAEAQRSRRSDEASATIPEAVNVTGDRKAWRSQQLIWLDQIMDARRMDAEKRNHGDLRRNVKLNVIGQADQHGQLSTSCP